MPQGVRIDNVRFSLVKVTEHTEWTFAELSDTHDAATVVELTCGEGTGRAVALFTELAAMLRGKDIVDESSMVEVLNLDSTQLRNDRPLATAISGLRTAVVALQAYRNGVSLTEALEGKAQHSVPLYANINRSLLGSARTAKDFGAAAEQAVRAGFTIIKCAPFDEVIPPASTSAILDLARPGIERVAAIRSAVGSDVQVLVDCHARFEAHSAPLVAEELAKLGIGWFEEPLEPTKDAEGLMQIAKNVGMPLAGGESGYGEAFFADLISRGAVSIVMPDIKFCGGIAEARRIGRTVSEAGGQLSLHNPSGPVSQLASAHTTAAVSGALSLEHAVNEAPWRADLLEPRERIEGGRLWFPGGIGLGAVINHEMVRQHGRSWKV
ncbi:MAG: hypothetical protein IIC22_05310 [Chloroflexi bacterium]|nr:hypothetical protein [Chloroflexota bacterium]